MKKFVSMFLALVMCLSILGTNILAFAEETDREEDFFQTITDLLDNNPWTQVVVVSEEDIIAQRLEDQSITKEELNDEFWGLSSLPTAMLKQMGYNEAQIQVIHDYVEGDDAFTHFYGTHSTSAAATLTFKYGIAGPENTTKTVKLAYDMAWSNRPLYCFTDSFAVAWTAAGYNSEVLYTKVDEKSVCVQYGPTYADNEYINPKVTSNHLQADFSMLNSKLAYANHISGYATISTQSESYSMYSIQIYVSYAHAVKKLELKDEVGISVGMDGIVFNFTLAFPTKQEWIIDSAHETYQAKDYNGNIVYEAVGTE